MLACEIDHPGSPFYDQGRVEKPCLQNLACNPFAPERLLSAGIVRRRRRSEDEETGVMVAELEGDLRQVEVANPFWSQKAQEEARLRAK